MQRVGGGSPSWASITGKPSTFPPEAHSHVPADIVGLVSPIAGTATITVANNSLSHVETVAASGVTASQRVIASIAPHLDSDENDAEMLDVLALSAAAGTGQITVDIAFATMTAGQIKINWVAL